MELKQLSLALSLLSGHFIIQVYKENMDTKAEVSRSVLSLTYFTGRQKSESELKSNSHWKSSLHDVIFKNWEDA